MISQGLRSPVSHTLARKIGLGGAERFLVKIRTTTHRRSTRRSLSILTHRPFAGVGDEREERNRQFFAQAVPCILVVPPSIVTSRCFFATSSGLKQEDSFGASSRIKKRAADMSSNVRNKAVSIRDSAQEHYKDFREHPSESAAHGARTIGVMMKLYGPVFVGTYLGVYFSTLGALFLGVESGLMDPVSLFGWLGHASDAGGETKNTVQLVVQAMEHYSFTAPYAHVIEKNPEFANLAVAWVAVKFTEPLRLMGSFAITPRIARYFGFTPRVDVADDTKAGSPDSNKDDASDDKHSAKDSSLKDGPSPKA